MNIRKNVSLEKYNTFHINAKAREFLVVENLQELKQALQYTSPEDTFILGGGSNMLLTQNIHKFVIHLQNKGIDILEQTHEYCLVEVQAGEVWHDFVLWAIDNNLGGIENLSLIPGNVGTAPIQNIGAYGSEVKDTIVTVHALNKRTLTQDKFTNSQCKFAYRESIFKNTHKDQYVITSVVFKLTKGNHQIKTQYGAIEHELKQRGITVPTIKDISDVVIQIRKNKLPDPNVIGNSGSFFKNPIISIEKFKELQLLYPDIPNYPIDLQNVKVPAGWLIEKSGLKGFRIQDAGVHDKQALVLVNHDKATGEEILNLSQLIQLKVFNLFGIMITPEVNIF